MIPVVKAEKRGAATFVTKTAERTEVTKDSDDDDYNLLGDSEDSIDEEIRQQKKE